MSVGGTYSDSGHQYIQLDSSIDFARLVTSPPTSYWGDNLPKLHPTSIAKNLPPRGGDDVPIDRYGSCDKSGGDLQGDLGLKEKLAMGIMAAAQNDIAVFPRGSDPSAPPPSFSGTFDGTLPDKRTFTGHLSVKPVRPPKNGVDPGLENAVAGGNVGIYGLTPPVAIPATYPFGQFSIQVDFTIVENVNAGPTWTTEYFKGPGGAATGLGSLNRQVKDTLLITFVPVCIREAYHPKKTGAKDYEYEPEMVDGTPGWANFLPSCASDIKDVLKVNALVAAKFTNSTLTVQPLNR